MKKNVNIAVVGLGQIGSYLLNELNTKKRDIELKTGKKIKLLLYLQKTQIKRENIKLIKNIFYKNPL